MSVILQTISSGSSIQPVTGSTDHPAIFSLQGQTTNFTLTTINDTTCVLTGTPVTSSHVHIVAKGQSGGILVSELFVQVGAIVSDPVQVTSSSGSFDQSYTSDDSPVTLSNQTISIKSASAEVSTYDIEAQTSPINIELTDYLNVTASFEVNGGVEGTINNQVTTGFNLVDDDANVVTPIAITPVGNIFTIEVTKPVFVVTQAYYDGITPNANTYYLIDG